MKTKSTKSNTKQWVLKHKESGKLYSNFSYPTRSAARKAANGKRFKGLYTPVKSGDGGIDPKKIKKTKPAPKPKSSITSEVSVDGFNAFQQFFDWLLRTEEEETTLAPVTSAFIESQTMTKTAPYRTNVNKTPKLRKSSSAVGSKFHRHGTFGVKV